MSVIIIEGPEKAGKSTLANVLYGTLSPRNTGGRVVIRHQTGRARPDDRMYAEQLAEDTSQPASKLIAIWDRGWPSEYVYGTLLKQDRRLAADPWLGEWLHGRAVAANGLRVMLTGPNSKELKARRKGDDLPVDPAAEQALYTAYGLRFGWTVLGQAPIDTLVRIVLEAFDGCVSNVGALPPNYAGDPNAEIVVVGDERVGRVIPGGWLPFSTPLASIIGRMLGDDMTAAGWVYAYNCPPETLRSAKTLITCGPKALAWVRNYVMREGGGQRLIEWPNPSYAFSYNNETTR
jgi:hypothetical protein